MLLYSLHITMMYSHTSFLAATTQTLLIEKNCARLKRYDFLHRNIHGKQQISRPMRIVAPILFSAVFHQEIAGYGPFQSTHQGHHQENTGYVAGY